MNHHLRSILVALGVLLLAERTATAQVPCRYEVTYWPNVDCGFGPNPGNPVAVNDSGHVCARWTSCGDPVPLTLLWTGGPTTQVLPIPPGYVGMRPEDMNNAGEIVGELYQTNGGQPRAFFRNASGTVTPLTFPPDVNASWATSINNKSQVAGYCNTSNGNRPYIWKDGVLTMIAVPAGSWTANDINDVGQIALWQSGSQGYVWSNGDLQPVGLLPGGSDVMFPWSPARSIANNGNVTGRATIPDADSQSGFVFRAYFFDGKRLINLGTLPEGIESEGVANNDHVVVGISSEATGGVAFDFTGGKMRRLDQLQPNANLTLYHAGAISRAGIIAANGRIGNPHVGAVLRPVFAPVGDITADCQVGVPDLLAVINSWGACNPDWFCSSDVNGDLVVNVWDIIMLIQHWGQQS